jgi:hypothetical protein
MARIENETDDLQGEHEEARSAPPGAWNRPLLLAGLGLALMLGGYAALDYMPRTPRQAEQERQIAELREMTARSGTAAEALDERLKQVAPPWRTPPYQVPGRLAIYGGLVLFVVAGVSMYRNTPAPKKQTDEEDSDI